MDSPKPRGLQFLALTPRVLRAVVKNSSEPSPYLSGISINTGFQVSLVLLPLRFGAGIILNVDPNTGDCICTGELVSPAPCLRFFPRLDSLDTSFVPCESAGHSSDLICWAHAVANSAPGRPDQNSDVVMLRVNSTTGTVTKIATIPQTSELFQITSAVHRPLARNTWRGGCFQSSFLRGTFASSDWRCRCVRSDHQHCVVS